MVAKAKTTRFMTNTPLESSEGSESQPVISAKNGIDTLHVSDISISHGATSLSSPSFKTVEPVVSDSENVAV